MKWAAFLFIALLFTTSQVTAELQDDLVVYFTFDKVEGKKILDASGNDLDADVIANVDFVKGKYGDAIHIAAEPEGSDCVHIPADDLLKIEDEITMMAWVYHEDWSTASGELFNKGSNIVVAKTNDSYSLGLFHAPQNPKFPEGFELSGIEMTLGSPNLWRGFRTLALMVDKKWHHIAGTYDGNAVRIYLDGKIRYDREEKFKFIGFNSSELRIGCAKDQPQYTFKNSSIDEAGLWQRALTQAEIEEAMEGGLAVSPKDKVATTWGDIKRPTIVYK